MGTDGDSTNDSITFPTLDADSADNVPITIESLCMNCEDNGITRIFLTKIPHFREVIIMSFHCDHCGFRNNELQSGGKIHEHGLKLTLKVQHAVDLNRQIVKSQYATVHIPDVDLTIPYSSTNAEITTVEGILRRVSDSLVEGQSRRQVSDPDSALKIADFVAKLTSLQELERPFTLIIDDPSGDSFVENPHLSAIDRQLMSVQYQRSFEQEKIIGMRADHEVEGEPDTVCQDGKEEVAEHATAEEADITAPADASDALTDEVLTFQEFPCYSCGKPAVMNMKLIENVPHFPNVMVMASSCTYCGYKDTEVKSNSGIQKQGLRITIRPETPADLKREVLKSEACGIEIPELKLECGMAAMSSRMTTVEGLLSAMKEQLTESGQFLMGDSCSDAGEQSSFQNVLDTLGAMRMLEVKGSVILDDPSGNTYVERLCNTGDDSAVTLTYYERTWEQNEELGINDMKLEDYEQDEGNRDSQPLNKEENRADDTNCVQDSIGGVASADSQDEGNR